MGIFNDAKMVFELTPDKTKDEIGQKYFGYLTIFMFYFMLPQYFPSSLHLLIPVFFIGRIICGIGSYSPIVMLGLCINKMINDELLNGFLLIAMYFIGIFLSAAILGALELYIKSIILSLTKTTNVFFVHLLEIIPLSLIVLLFYIVKYLVNLILK